MVQIQDRNNKVIEIGDLFLGIKFSGEHPVGYNAEMDDSINKILRVTDVEDDDTWGQVVSADNNFYYPANRIRVLGKDMEKVSRLRVGAKFVTCATNTAMRHITDYPFGKTVEITELSDTTAAVKADGYWWEQANVLDNLIPDPVEFKVADESMKALEEAVREMQTVHQPTLGQQFAEAYQQVLDSKVKPATMKASKQVPKMHLWAVYDPEVDILWGAEETRRQARELNRQMGGGNRIYKMQAVAKVT